MKLWRSYFGLCLSYLAVTDWQNSDEIQYVNPSAFYMAYTSQNQKHTHKKKKDNWKQLVSVQLCIFVDLLHYTVHSTRVWQLLINCCTQQGLKFFCASFLSSICASSCNEGMNCRKTQTVFKWDILFVLNMLKYNIYIYGYTQLYSSLDTYKKSVPLQVRGAQRVPGSQGSHITWQWHRMVVRLSALRTGRFLPPGNTPGTHLC